MLCATKEAIMTRLDHKSHIEKTVDNVQIQVICLENQVEVTCLSFVSHDKLPASLAVFVSKQVIASYCALPVNCEVSLLFPIWEGDMVRY